MRAVSGRSAGFESVLSQTLPKIAEEAAAEFGVSHGIERGEPSISSIQQVVKPRTGDNPSPAQRGTNLAHHLCAQSKSILGAGVTGRIIGRDATAAVREIMEVSSSAAR